MAWFAIGVFVGGLFTMLLMALFSLGSDREIEQRKQGKKKDGDDDGESR